MFISTHRNVTDKNAALMAKAIIPALLALPRADKVQGAEMYPNDALFNILYGGEVIARVQSSAGSAIWTAIDCAVYGLSVDAIWKLAQHFTAELVE